MCVQQSNIDFENVNTKHQGNNLINNSPKQTHSGNTAKRETKYFIDGNFKMLKKEIEEDTRFLMLMDLKN